ncbi:MAG: phosphatase PAP2 family protein [Clostridia bacterium]|nr:phosphatase PAP2 family protein [Clostridia bacterium]
MGAWIDTAFRGLDLRIFEIMHRWAVAAGENAGAEITSFLTHLMNFISFFAHDGLCMFALGVVLMLFRRTRRAGACVFLAVCCGGLITNITLKPLISRMRPYANMEHLGMQVREWWTYVGEARKAESIVGSFPSGHTTSATAAMVGLFLTTKKKYTWPVLLFPIFMGISRIYLMVHYTSDVLAGLVAGTLGAIGAFFLVKLFWHLLQKHENKRLCKFILSFDLIVFIRRLFKKDTASET